MKVGSIFGIVFVLIASFLGSVRSASADSGQPTTASNVVVVTITGRITKKTLESVRASSPRSNADPIPAGLIVLLDSSGGDGVAAMEVGRILRLANAHIFVTGQCSSACMFILASGVVRGAPAYSVGIHRGRITVTDESGKILKEVNASENPKAAAALTKFEREAEGYFAEMGMSPSLFQAMQSHTQKGVYRLSHSEVAKYGLTGFEKKYFDARAEFYASQRGVYKMDGAELSRRTAKVASRCGEYQGDRKRFVSCYAEVLRDRYLN